MPVRSRLSRRRNDPLLTELIDVLLSPPAQAQDRFTSVMHELFSYGQAHDLRALLASEDAVRVLGDAWRQRWPEILPGPLQIIPTLGDAVAAMQLLDDAGIEIPFPQSDLHVRSIDPNAAALIAERHPLKIAATDENDLDAFPQKIRGSTRTTGD